PPAAAALGPALLPVLAARARLELRRRLRPQLLARRRGRRLGPGLRLGPAGPLRPPPLARGETQGVARAPRAPRGLWPAPRPGLLLGAPLGGAHQRRLLGVVRFGRRLGGGFRLLAAAAARAAARAAPALGRLLLLDPRLRQRRQRLGRFVRRRLGRRHLRAQ